MSAGLPQVPTHDRSKETSHEQDLPGPESERRQASIAVENQRNGRRAGLYAESRVAEPFCYVGGWRRESTIDGD